MWYGTFSSFTRPTYGVVLQKQGIVNYLGSLQGRVLFSKIIGVSWKEGIVRLEVDK